MGWRMGLGEDYLHHFAGWYGRLSVTDRRLYQDLYAEPSGWDGFFRTLDRRLEK